MAVRRLGLDGEVCALRLVCETTARPLVGAGLLGEIFNLVLRSGMLLVVRRSKGAVNV